MTERQILLVKNSWTYVIVKSDVAGNLFYARLFEIAPELRPMFKEDIKDQAKKLMSMVTLIVTKLHKLDEIIGEVKLLANRHGRYGVKAEQYRIVGEALIWTLKNGLGEKWNAEVEEAWIKIYSILSQAMIANREAAVL